MQFPSYIVTDLSILWNHFSWSYSGKFLQSRLISEASGSFALCLLQWNCSKPTVCGKIPYLNYNPVHKYDFHLSIAKITILMGIFRNSSAFVFTVTESAHSKSPSARGRFPFDIIYTFSRTLQQVQSPGLNCYNFHPNTD